MTSAVDRCQRWRRSRALLLLLCVARCSSFTGTRWRCTLSVGKLASNAPASFATPPLAMFTPGGGRAEPPSWFPEDWAISGARLFLPLDVDFCDTATAAPLEEGPFRNSKARRLATPDKTAFIDMTGEVSVSTRGVAWVAKEISSIESLLVWRVDLPDGARKGDVSLPADSSLYLSTRVFKRLEVEKLGEALPALQRELQRELETPQTMDGGPGELKERIERRRALEARVERLTRGLPAPDSPTATLEPGSLLAPPAADWSPSGLTVAQEGQVSIRRLTRKLPRNPFELRPDPFRAVEEYGVIGSFKMVLSGSCA